MHAQLSHQVGSMNIDGFRRNTQITGNFAVTSAVGNQSEDLSLSIGQLTVGVGSRCLATDEFIENLAAFSHLTHSRHDGFVRRTFQQDAINIEVVDGLDEGVRIREKPPKEIE